MKVSRRSSTQAISLTMVLFVAFLAGCASQLTQAPASLLPSEHLADKNYKIGEPKMVNVGEPLVKFQDYWTIRTEKPVATINKTVTLKGGPVDTFMEAGKQYPIVGQTRDGNRVFMLVQLHNALAMVNQDGSLHNHVAGIQPAGVMSGSVITVVWELEISDPSARVSRGVDQQIDTAKGYENFEIIYTGVNSAGLNLTYREFSPEGVARVAFYQSLTYPADAGIVTFKNYKIEIHEANSESITYTVLQE